MSRYMQSEIDRLTAQVAVLEAKLARAAAVERGEDA